MESNGCIHAIGLCALVYEGRGHDTHVQLFAQSLFHLFSLFENARITTTYTIGKLINTFF